MAAGGIETGIRAVTPYLAVRDARAAIAFYGAAFGARQTLLLDEPGGRVGHATLAIGPAHRSLGVHLGGPDQAR